MVIEGKGRGACVCYFWMARVVAALLFAIFLIVCISSPSIIPDGYAKDSIDEVRKEGGGETILIDLKTLFIITLIYTLVTTGLRAYGTWKLWQSLKICETDVEEAFKCADMWLYTETVICCLSVLSFIFFLVLFFDLIFIWCGVLKYREGLRDVMLQKHAPGTDGGMTIIVTPYENDPLPAFIETVVTGDSPLNEEQNAPISPYGF